MIERIANGFGDFRSAGKPGQSFLQPGFQRLDERPGFLLSDSLALIGASAADLGFDLVKFRDPPQGLGGDRRRRRFRQVEELSPAMRPTISETDRKRSLKGASR